ncbi:MAG: hypothetical protein V1735_07520 [Nanoarchaeota archaeon]
MKKVEVSVEGASSKAVSFQCPSCDYFTFETASSQKVLAELRESPLKLRQKVVCLSANRLGLYLNQHLVRSLGITKGDEVLVSVPDKRHILIELP